VQEHKDIFAALPRARCSIRFEDFFTVALVSGFAATRELFGGFGLRVVERGAGKDHAVVPDDGIQVGVAFTSVVALDQCRPFRTARSAAGCRPRPPPRCGHRRLSSFVDDHGANAVAYTSSSSDPVHGKRIWLRFTPALQAVTQCCR
jgi:hypothetical protein